MVTEHWLIRVALPGLWNSGCRSIWNVGDPLAFVGDGRVIPILDLSSVRLEVVDLAEEVSAADVPTAKLPMSTFKKMQ